MCTLTCTETGHKKRLHRTWRQSKNMKGETIPCRQRVEKEMPGGEEVDRIRTK